MNDRTSRRTVLGLLGAGAATGVLSTAGTASVLSRSYGMAIKEDAVPNGKDTIFALASVSRSSCGARSAPTCAASLPRTPTTAPHPHLGMVT